MNFICVADWELLLYLLQIFFPIIALVLWIKDSSYAKVFDHITSRLMCTAAALLEYWHETHQKRKAVSVPDKEKLNINITSKVENPHNKKVSVKWLISWKSMPEKNSGQATGSDCPNGVSITGEPSNGGTNFTFYDSNGTKFNINASVQGLDGKYYGFIIEKLTWIIGMTIVFILVVICTTFQPM